jgi:hypothetical protein
VFAEILRVLKPGQYFACYEWCLTDKYDKDNAEHRLIKKQIEEGDGLPDTAYTWEMDEALRKVRAQRDQHHRYHHHHHQYHRYHHHHHHHRHHRDTIVCLAVVLVVMMAGLTGAWCTRWASRSSRRATWPWTTSRAATSGACPHP